MSNINNDSTNLNKYISNSGYCSRREADRLIEQGRISINNKIAELGNRVKAGDKVYIDGELIKNTDKRIYIALHKPEGIISTTDQNIKGNIIDYLGFPNRIFPIGRLDKASEGLIFLTSDGDIVNKILRAGNNHEKEYIVTVDKPITSDFLFKMGNGVPVLDTITNNCKVKADGKQTFRITLTQGLNRQIRRMCEYLGYSVVRLKRIRIMNISLGNLPVGQWRYLTPAELDIIQTMIADSSNTQEASVDEFAPKKRFALDRKPEKRPSTLSKEGQGVFKKTFANDNSRNASKDKKSAKPQRSKSHNENVGAKPKSRVSGSTGNKSVNYKRNAR